MDSFSTLIQTLAQMADGLKGISNGLTELNTGYQMSYKALDQAVNSIPDISLTNDQISNLYAAVSVGDSSQLESLDTLLEVYKSALTIKSTYQHVKAGFDAIDTTINTLVPTLDQMENGLKEISQQMNTAYSDNDITAQISQLTAGLSELSSNYTVFHNGLVSYMNGVTQLSNGYVDFQNGLSQYSDGMNSFQDGMSKLNKGTEELSEQTSDLPTQLEDKISEIEAEYSGKDYEPVSFLSSNNTKINLVQFVLKTSDITLPDQDEVMTVEQPKKTLWQRFIQLFQA